MHATCETISDRYLAGLRTVASQAKQNPGYALYCSTPAAVTVRRVSISLHITHALNAATHQPIFLSL